MMTPKVRIAAACLASGLLLTGCTQNGSFSNAGLGAALGGALGAGAAAAGHSKPSLVALAGLGGAAIGGLFGNMLDEHERQAAAMATQQIAYAPPGTQVPWQVESPHSRSNGWVTALGTPYEDANGRECRKVRIEAVSASGTSTGDHIACNQPRGAAATSTSGTHSGWVID